MSPSLQQVLESDRLPSLPQVALQIIKLAEQADPDPNEVIRVLRADPALAARILKTANSALYGLSHRVESIETAVTLLGISLLRAVVLSFSLASRDDNWDDKILARLWRSCLTQAVFAELAADELPEADPPTFFLAGLLQDIGILALLRVDGPGYMEHVWKKSQFANFVATERIYLGYSHADVSAGLCRKWGIADEFAKAVRCHHDTLMEDDLKLASVLRMASMCAGYFENQRRHGGRYLQRLCHFGHDHFEWDQEQTEALIKETMFRVEETARLFAFDIGGGFAHERILADAKRILEDIAIQNELELARREQEQNDIISDAVNRDALTGVYNRRFLECTLQRELQPLLIERNRLGLLFLDVDRFKQINDEYGHQAGDDAIRTVAQLLVESVRDCDFVIRYGGDEFLVVLKLFDQTLVSTVAERIRNRIESHRFSNYPNLEMTVSIGALNVQAGQGDKPDDTNWLIHLVDDAMYRAKRQGGNQICLVEAGGFEGATSL